MFLYIYIQYHAINNRTAQYLNNTLTTARDIICHRWHNNGGPIKTWHRKITKLDFFSEKKKEIPTSGFSTMGARRWLNGVDETPKILGVCIWNPQILSELFLFDLAWPTLEPPDF